MPELLALLSFNDFMTGDLMVTHQLGIDFAVTMMYLYIKWLISAMANGDDSKHAGEPSSPTQGPLSEEFI